MNPYQLQIDNWLRTSPHITASRIGALLREQCGELVIRERALRYFVANRRSALIPREAFIRAVYTPGAQAQFDFTPVSVNLAGVLVVLQPLCVNMRWGQLRDIIIEGVKDLTNGIQLPGARYRSSCKNNA